MSRRLGRRNHVVVSVLYVVVTGSFGWSRRQGHAMDLFLKISVLQAHFCWLEDEEEIIVLGRKVLLGKR